jgi:hypothetical protein
MSQAANGNVVAIGDHPRARTRLSPQESASLLSGCRDLALNRMAAALGSMLDHVEDELFELAEKADDRDSQNVYLDARAQAREKRAVIESAFRQHFVEFFNRKVRGEQGPKKEAAVPGELSLMGDEDLEEGIAVSEMSRKLKAACEGELGPLSQRMGFLLERATLEDDANPMSPELVCDALKRAFDSLQTGFKVRMALLRQVERHAETEIQRVYHDVNVHLVERRVLPEVQAVRRPAQPRKEEPKAVPSPAGKDAAPAPNDLFGSLAQLIGASMGAASMGAAPMGGGAMAASPQGPATWPLAEGGSMPPPAPALMQQLTKMHRELPVLGVEALSAASPEALVNVVRNVKASAPSLGAVDAMTIDIVAMLFDYIFDDRHIPASVKALIGRLQIPTLKVALMDKSFFSSKAHPARRLIDLLAEASMGLDASTAAGRAALEMVEKAVGRVLEEFEADVTPFESAIADVESFVDDQKRAEEQIVERSARLIEARERQELARMVAEEEVSRRLAVRQWVPPAVRTMLERDWMRALTDVHAVEGEGSGTWQGFMLTMDDLLWSVEPKCTSEERKRLVTMLPAMLRHLHDGLHRAKTEDADRDAFFGSLVDCHAAAVKAGLRGIAIVPDTPPPPPPVEPVSIESEVIPAGDVQVEEIRLKTSRGSQVRNVFTRTGVWTNLQRGTWVEFTRPSHEPMRARLTWISPNKGVYLFTNPMSEASALSVSPEALAEQMRLGQARVLDDAALVDRAVDSMLATLKRA